MRERGSSDRQSGARASEQGDRASAPLRERNRFRIPPLIPGRAAVPPTVAASVSAETTMVPKIQSSGSERADGELLEKVEPGKSAPVEAEVSQKLRHWSSYWQFWAGLATVTAGGVGFTAVALLLKLPTVPNCPSMYWPTASASMRLYCAQLAAKKQTVKDLLEAIALVQSLPPDHPMRQEVNEEIEVWSKDILDLAEKSFDAGKLDEAISIARKIPADVPAYKLVEDRIKSWKSLWSRAEKVYKDAEDELREQNWTQAFREAVRLLYIGNTYWETTKYEELNQLITSARDDGETLGKAQNQARRGGVKNLLKAIELVESIDPKSYLYKEAQAAIVEFGGKMMELAEAQLESRNVDEAIAIARQIPGRANMQGEVQDFIDLARAQSVAQQGTAASLSEAIALVKKLTPDRPLYSKGQDLIIRWQRELEDIAHLEKARQLAQLSTASDLKSAIKEVQLIPASHPRADEAKTEISRWTAQIQTMEDRPYLSRAEQMASLGDETSLQAAIDEANQIAVGRALYREAQDKVKQWTGQIQRIQDQPYLDQARQLARGGNLVDAIAIAQQIKSGRALSGEAQAAMKDWQAQIQAQQNLQQARSVATQATPDALASAIRLAKLVPSSSPLRSEAEEAINQWSYQMLSQAQDRATYDLQGAIAIAKTIPSGTSAYGEARAQIDVWQNILNPPAIPSPEPIAPSPESVAPPPAPPPVEQTQQSTPPPDFAPSEQSNPAPATVP
ncbi:MULTISPECIES: chromosome segregation ATPase [Oscillatoriales]|uniref:Chromosome segregation ATPase n=1 Tax=Aerosakkonema funiforme FACHB-1375 TaxID=2949571 RepID=A0A926VCX6_9CYAN|nr:MULTISPECIES: chromosome segregation ATPase [Oscillatoriales]MBD2181579.1 chromosome segregation ATPase [Aerosakkonema funiforme FACHB-1375]